MFTMPTVFNTAYMSAPYLYGTQYPVFLNYSHPYQAIQRDGLGGVVSNDLNSNYFNIYNYSDSVFAGSYDYDFYPAYYEYPSTSLNQYIGAYQIQEYPQQNIFASNYNYYPTYNVYPSADYPLQNQNNQILSNFLSRLNNYSFGDLTAKNLESNALLAKKSEMPTYSLKLSDKELDRMGFNTPELKERWKHLKPEFQRALIKLTNYAESKGIKISYGRRSTWRSHQDQIDMKKERGHFAAKPGHSPHEKGIAVDITTTSVNGNKRSNRENQALLGAYWESLGYRWGGHFQNFAKEPWHFDIKATRS